MRTAITLLCVIGFCTLAAMAQKLSDKKAARAIGAMRTLNTAQVTYATTYKDHGFACGLMALGEGPEGTKADVDHAFLISRDLASGYWQGYTYKVSCADKTSPHKVYKAQAEPKKHKGRAFCSDQSGIIRYSDDGKAATCFESGKPLE